WIVPAYASSVFRRIALRHLVENLGVVLQRLEPMREIFRDVQHSSIFRGELHREILLERRRGWPQIDNDVINRSRSTPHQLCFREWGGLVMHSPERPFP